LKEKIMKERIIKGTVADLICLLYCQSSDTVPQRNISAKFQKMGIS